MEAKAHTIQELEEMTETELETLIMGKKGNTDEARYVLGKLLIDGTSDKVPKKENKGLNWLKEAVKNKHMGALEYQTYWNIRFSKTPQLQKIKDNLEAIINANKSTRACNTLAELNHASAGSDLAKSNPEAAVVAAQNKDNAAKFYMMSAEQEDVIGMHWMGVFYHEGFGVSKNLDKAVDYLTKAAAAGNGQSYYQLYIIHSGKEGQDSSRKNAEVAYNNLMDGIIRGVTYFDEAITFFKENYDVLAPLYVKNKGLKMEINADTKQDINNMHEAHIGELKVAFSAALGKDRLYHKPTGFLNDQQIWMVGVQLNYMVESVLRFDHADFMKAMKQDLGPILGDLGLWCVKTMQEGAKERGDNELKKKL